MSVNKVCISGNLTRDAEVRVTQGGTTVIAFGVAVSERRQNPQTQEWEDKPNFVDCVMFDRNGTRQWMANALRKGFKVYVSGKLSYSSWVDRDTGKNRSKLEVVVQDIDASWPPRQQGGYAQQPPQYPQAPQQQQYYPNQAPMGYQQAPQGYGQPAQAPQQPQAANYPTQAQYAPQRPPQAPTQAPQQQPAQQAAPQQGQIDDLYDEDIPF